MSAIASYYLVPRQKTGELIGAARAQSQALVKKRWGIFRPRLPLSPDPLWSYIKTQTTELEEFPYSGYLLLDVGMFAKGVLSKNGADGLGTKLYEITGLSFVSFDTGDARKAIDVIDATDFSAGRIRAFLEENGRTADYPGIVQPLQDASRRLQAWLACVTDEQVGLLNIG